jgi:hypothetical protein
MGKKSGSGINNPDYISESLRRRRKRGIRKKIMS